MLVIVSPEDVDRFLAEAKNYTINAQVAGRVKASS
jgi:phosphoribosylaminoimidazole (AIR) synthetase